LFRLLLLDARPERQSVVIGELLKAEAALAVVPRI
jgi:hypothetical protein